MGFFQGTQERVRNSRGKRAISVRATEVLLYAETMKKYGFQWPQSFLVFCHLQIFITHSVHFSPCRERLCLKMSKSSLKNR